MYKFNNIIIILKSLNQIKYPIGNNSAWRVSLSTMYSMDSDIHKRSANKFFENQLVVILDADGSDVPNESESENEQDLDNESIRSYSEEN